MENKIVVETINKAIKTLFEKDFWLIEHDISEQSISHKLAEYLQPLFPDYNVDYEYNGNVDRDNGRKKIEILKSELKKANLLTDGETQLNQELIERAVFPDIIIHQRGTNDKNLCIIEVKKSTNNTSRNYDFIKLKSYTSTEYGNDLIYKLGLFINFRIPGNISDINFNYFISGYEVSYKDI